MGLFKWGIRPHVMCLTVHLSVCHRDGGSLLANRRLFAVVDVGVPDGIKVDVEGNIWTAVGDGVAAFSKSAHLPHGPFSACIC